MAQRVRKKPMASASTTDRPPSPGTAELKHIATLKANWDSYGAAAPNAKSIATARFVLKVLHSIGFTPVRVMPSVEGGVAIVLSAPPRYADVECFNSGKILVGYSPDDEDSQVVELTRATLIREVPRLRAYVQASHSETDAQSRSRR